MAETATTTLRQVAPEAALRALRAAPDGGRGFLGLDPVVQNDAALTAGLAARGAWLFTTDGADGAGAGGGGNAGSAAVLAAAVSPDNPRQAEVAVSGDAPGAVRELLEFLRAYRRCESFTARADRGAAAGRVWEAAGFRTSGVLREHVYRGGAYRDVVLYHFDPADSSQPADPPQPADPADPSEPADPAGFSEPSGSQDGQDRPDGQDRTGGPRRPAGKGPVA